MFRGTRTPASPQKKKPWSQYKQVPSVYCHLNVHGTFVPKNFTLTNFTSSLLVIGSSF